MKHIIMIDKLNKDDAFSKTNKKSDTISKKKFYIVTGILLFIIIILLLLLIFGKNGNKNETPNICITPTVVEITFTPTDTQKITNVPTATTKPVVNNTSRPLPTNTPKPTNIPVPITYILLPLTDTPV